MIELNNPEPFGYFRTLLDGWQDCAATDEGARPLYDEDAISTQAARIAELEAEVERLRAGLLETARMVEDLKKPVSMDDPESHQAARNSLYMSISYFARAIEAAKDKP